MQPEFITYRVVMSEHRERIARAERRAQIIELRRDTPAGRRRWRFLFGFRRHRTAAGDLAVRAPSAAEPIARTPATVPRSIPTARPLT